MMRRSDNVLIRMQIDIGCLYYHSRIQRSSRTFILFFHPHRYYYNYNNNYWSKQENIQIVE